MGAVITIITINIITTTIISLHSVDYTFCFKVINYNFYRC